MDMSATGVGGTDSKASRPTKRQRAAAKAAPTAATTRGLGAPAPSETRAEAPPIEAAPATATPTTPQSVTPVSAAAPVEEDGTSLDAERVALRRSAVGRIETTDMTVEQGAVGAVRAERVSIERGALGAAMADHVELSRGYARSILARQVQLDRAAARVVIAADVRATQSAVMFLVARKVDGDVKVLFDWRGALAFGAVAGVVLALLSRARGGRVGRERGARGRGRKDRA